MRKNLYEKKRKKQEKIYSVKIYYNNLYNLQQEKQWLYV